MHLLEFDVNEEWRDVAEFSETHAVSDLGRVKSKERLIVRGRGKVRQREIILNVDAGTGYERVVITINGKRHYRAVHRLVAIAFLPPPQSDDANQVMHLDGSKSNNLPSNLSWGTGSQNQQMRVEHGTDNRGERHAQSSISEAQANEIISRRKKRESLSSIASDYDITPSLVCAIAKGRAWKHLERDYDTATSMSANRKLTDSQVREIRTRRGKGEKIVPLGQEFGVAHGVISKIHSRKTYAEVKDV